MSLGTRPPARAPYPAAPVVALTLGLFGLVAAAIGVWISAASSSSTLTFLFWSWRASEIADIWSPLLLIGGGAVAFVAAGAAVALNRSQLLRGWPMVVDAVLAAAGIAAVILGIAVLI